MSRIDSEAVDAALSAPIEDGRLVAAVATAADSGGVLYEGAAGHREMGGAAMTPDTVIWIASMTKAVTGTCAMQLVEQGKLSLDAPASEVCGDLANTQVLDGFDADGQAVVRPPRSPITLRNLLTHTSGFGYDIWSSDLCNVQEQHGIPGVTTCENAALTTPLLFDPGTAWMYGIGIDWAGKMVEAVSGQTLGQYMTENVFEPLGMNSTAFKITDEMRSRLCGVHARGEGDALGPFPFEIPQEPEFEMGGGGLYSTLQDYLRFLRAMLGGGELDGTRIIGADTVATMMGNHIGDINVVTLETAIPPYSNNANLFPDQDNQKWGLTWAINAEETAAGRAAGSVAWAGLANSYYWIDPTNDLCGVWGTQVVPFADPISLDAFADFEKAVYAAR